MQNFIVEGALFQEAEIVKVTAEKAIFKIILQTADEINQNKRMYPKKVLANAMNQAEDRINNRKFLGEMDHPLATGNDIFDGVRQTTVLLKEASHLVRTYEWRGNNIVGECETLRTPNGKIALGLLLDKVTIGVSLRGMAELSRENGINIVQDPLYIIDYDLVSLPSHKGSTVNFDEMRFEHKSLISESKNCICSGGICYLPDYFDKLVESKAIKFFQTWV